MIRFNLELLVIELAMLDELLSIWNKYSNFAEGYVFMKVIQKVLSLP